jgi:hypothetical protein
LPLRKRVALLVIVVVGTCSAALASPQFKSTFALSYLSADTGVSTGLTTRMTWSDPGEPGGAPKAIKKITLRFQRGTVFDTSALPACSTSDDAIKAMGASACPAKSRLGSGHTIGATSDGTRFTTDVTLFNAKRQIIVLVTLNGTTVTEFRDRVRRSTVSVAPALPLGVSLERLTLRIDPHARGSGAARKIYMRTPLSCPKSRHWKIVGTFEYADDTSETRTSATRCRAARAPASAASNRRQTRLAIRLTTGPSPGSHPPGATARPRR